MSDIATGAAGAHNAAIGHQLSIAAVKTANDVQKQEGKAAVDLIQSATQSATQSSPGPTGNNIDVEV